MRDQISKHAVTMLCLPSHQQEFQNWPWSLSESVPYQQQNSAIRPHLFTLSQLCKELIYTMLFSYCEDLHIVKLKEFFHEPLEYSGPGFLACILFGSVPHRSLAPSLSHLTIPAWCLLLAESFRWILIVHSALRRYSWWEIDQVQNPKKPNKEPFICCAGYYW